MLGLPVQIGHEGCIAFFLESIELCTLCGTHICGNYVIESTCYSVKSERIYTCQKEMEDLQIEVIKSAFVRSLNEKLEHRDVVLGNLKEIRNLISGGERTLQQQTALWKRAGYWKNRYRHTSCRTLGSQWIRNSTRKNLMGWWNATAG